MYTDEFKNQEVTVSRLEFAEIASNRINEISEYAEVVEMPSETQNQLIQLLSVFTANVMCDLFEGSDDNTLEVE